MEEKQKTEIYNRVSGEFNVNVLHKYYYCAGISYFTLCDRMRIRYGPTAEIFMRVDHVVVRESTGGLTSSSCALTAVEDAQISCMNSLPTTN